MILPIYSYGCNVLNKKTNFISSDYDNLKDIISNMFETMYNASGVGLAAPQVGISISLFIVDASPFKEEDPSTDNFKKIFINPKIIEQTGDDWCFNEGCLSIPNIRHDIIRKSCIKIQYYNENFELFEESFSGIKARIIQHEYDHLNGVLFTDYLSSLKKRLIKRKLYNISKGNIDVNYRMKFPLK